MGRLLARFPPSAVQWTMHAKCRYLAAIANTYQGTIQLEFVTVRQGDSIAGVRQMQENEPADAQILYRVRFFASCSCN